METTAAILLRRRKFSDTTADRLVVHGANWVRSNYRQRRATPESPFAEKLDLFFEAEISIVRSRKTDLHTLAEVVLKNPFAEFAAIICVPTAAYFVELIEICTERDHHEPELFGLMRRAYGYLDTNNPTARAVSHFETELARLAGVHDQTRLKADPAFALGNYFGRVPFPRTPLLKTLATPQSSPLLQGRGGETDAFRGHGRHFIKVPKMHLIAYCGSGLSTPVCARFR